jgi:hypothetical protein
MTTHSANEWQVIPPELVHPGLLVYRWTLHEPNGVPWLVVCTKYALQSYHGIDGDVKHDSGWDFLLLGPGPTLEWKRWSLGWVRVVGG